MKIKILDSVECEISKDDGKILFPCLSFTATYWVQGPYKRRPKSYQKDVFTFKGKKVWRFYTGLLPRVKKWCREQNIPLKIDGEELKLPRQNPPFLKGITFREDQIKLIEKACYYQRGCIQAPTGVGKTIMQLGIISCFPDSNFLLLAHNIDIVSQTYKKARELGFKSVEMFGGDNKIASPKKKLTISTMQSWIMLDPTEYVDRYDCVLLDEAHHLQKTKSKNSQGKITKSTYEQILSQMLAPIRLGFTATVRTNKEAQLINEGLLGPVIGKTTIEEAADMNILAKPKLRFIKAKCDSSILDLRKYQDVYDFGIVNNKRRNRQIAEIAKEFYDKKQTVLIFVTQIKHGELIVEEIQKLLKIKIPFVQGKMPQDDRNKIKNKLNKGEIRVCVATTSWREGVDIPQLNAVVNSGGGKSEIQTLQGVGRGLRKTDDKNEVVIIDFLDLKHFHLIRQLGERLSTYSDMRWL